MTNFFRSPLKALTLLAVIIGISLPAHAAPKVVKRGSPDQILNIAKGYGSAELSEDDDGDPYIQGRTEGLVYHVYFFNCEKLTGCRDIVLSAGFEVKDIGLERLNEWNKTSKFGQAYLDDDQDPNLDLAINLYGGTVYKNLDDTFDWWRASLVKFAKHINYGESEE